MASSASELVNPFRNQTYPLPWTTALRLALVGAVLVPLRFAVLLATLLILWPLGALAVALSGHEHSILAELTEGACDMGSTYGIGNGCENMARGQDTQRRLRDSVQGLR